MVGTPQQERRSRRGSARRALRARASAGCRARTAQDLRPRARPRSSVRVVRSGFRLASGDPEPASPPPALGADTGDLLAELGFSKREIDELARDGAM